MHIKNYWYLKILQRTSPKTNVFLFSNRQNYFSRNFYNMRMLALFVAFSINFILLFYKVTYPVIFLLNHLR